MNPPAQASGERLYIRPEVVHVYDTDYLFAALRKPSIPQWLKKKIVEELNRRGITIFSSVSKPAHPADIVAKPYKLEHFGEFNICYNSIEAYITTLSSCPEY